MTAMILLFEWERSQIEFWKPIQGFPGYDVSSKGRVRTWLIKVTEKGRKGLYCKIGKRTRMLSPQISKDGYAALTIRKAERHWKTVTVHLLVARTFIPNPNKWPQVNHINGRAKADNRVANLEWATQFRQARHAYDTGLNTPRMGGLNGNSRLTDSDVREIRRVAFRRPKIGNGQQLADKYGVSRTVINKVARGVTYKNVE